MQASDDLEIFVNCVPRAKARPRFRVQNGRVFTYTPKDTVDYEQFVAEQIREAYPDYVQWTDRVSLDLTFHMPIPKSLLLKFRYHQGDCSSLGADALVTPAAALYGSVYVPCKRCKPNSIAFYNPMAPMGKPDLDNLEKAVMDALQKSKVIADDKQVTEKASRKIYSATPGIHMRVKFGGVL